MAQGKKKKQAGSKGRAKKAGASRRVGFKIPLSSLNPGKVRKGQAGKFYRAKAVRVRRQGRRLLVDILK